MMIRRAHPTPSAARWVTRSSIRLAALGVAGGLLFGLAGCNRSYQSTSTVNLTSLGPVDAGQSADVGIGDPAGHGGFGSVAASPDDVSVRSRNGSIHIEVDPSISMMEVTADLRCGGPSQREADVRAAGATVRLVSVDGDGVRVEPVMPGGWQKNDAASFTIRIPEPAAVDAKSSNGRIDIVGPAGPLVLETSNGRISLRGTRGDASVESSNGRITIVGHQGSMRAHSSNGPVIVEDHLGPLSVRTSNGSMNIGMHDDARDAITIQTSNGTVKLDLGPAFDGWIDATTSNGTIALQGFESGVEAIETAKRRVRVKLAGDDDQSTVRTSNGGVKITRRAAAASAASAGAVTNGRAD